SCIRRYHVRRYSFSVLPYLRNFILKLALLHPSHAENVEQADKRTVGEAVFTRPGVTRRVVDRLFAHAPATHLHQRRQIAVRSAKKRQTFDRFRSIELKAARGIVNGFSGNPVADAVGLSRLPSAKWLVIALLSPATNHVVSI